MGHHTMAGPGCFFALINLNFDVLAKRIGTIMCVEMTGKLLSLGYRVCTYFAANTY
jgi:hypothetical protein